MKDSTTMLVLVLVLFIVLSSESAPAYVNPYGPAAGTPQPGPPSMNSAVDFPTGNDLGVFQPALALPGVGQAYGVLAPINSKILQPAVNRINNSAPVKGINTSFK